ncbi:MAG TPA: hypothetical protein VJT33_05430, partial [bacterium]|nr:hypothetical protein [bacterium]
DAPGVVAAVVGENAAFDVMVAGEPADRRFAWTAAANFDWIVDMQVRDPAAARALVDGPQYAEVTAAIAPATKDEWTARITHVMRGY